MTDNCCHICQGKKNSFLRRFLQSKKNALPGGHVFTSDRDVLSAPKPFGWCSSNSILESFTNLHFIIPHFRNGKLNKLQVMSVLKAAP
jgi:hypothetical protein